MISDICDNRDLMSTKIRDLRDSNLCVFRENTGMQDNRKKIRDWLQSELDRQGHGAKGKLAEYLGIRGDGVTRMLNTDPGKEMRDVSADELVRMGEFFRVAPPILKTNLKPVDMAPGSVRVVGKVAANSWIDVDEMDFGYEDEEPVPAAPGYPPSVQFALRVEGNCLNKIAPHGTRLICLSTIKAEYEPQAGDLVIVERKRFGGQMVERTAKRLRKSAKGLELWPESDDPLHQDPIALYESEEDTDVSMIGVVLWIMSKP